MKDRDTVASKVSELFDWKGGFSGMYLRKCFPIICNELFYGLANVD